MLLYKLYTIQLQDMEVGFPALTTTGDTRNSYIASAASSACRLRVNYYDPIYTVPILQFISGASKCSQPTIGPMVLHSSRLSSYHHCFASDCAVHLYLTNQHQAMAFSSNSRYCSPPALKMMILEETSHGRGHAGMCMTSYQPADSLQPHPWGLL